MLQSELDGENEWIADIRRQTDRLAELTAELVYLSKMEEENAALNMQTLSLSELVDETALSFQGLARAKGVEFRSTVEPGLNVDGDEKALARLVSILLDNAMKYSPEGGTAELKLDRSGKLWYTGHIRKRRSYFYALDDRIGHTRLGILVPSAHRGI